MQSVAVMRGSRKLRQGWEGVVCSDNAFLVINLFYRAPFAFPGRLGLYQYACENIVYSKTCLKRPLKEYKT